MRLAGGFRSLRVDATRRAQSVSAPVARAQKALRGVDAGCIAGDEGEHA